jgi:copper chaperone NosL
MTIVDTHFGTELLNTKGKPFKFDSIECLAAYCRIDDIGRLHVHSRWVTDYTKPESLLNAASATFVRSQSMRSPMGMGLFAFSNPADADSFAAINNGTVVSWDDMSHLVATAWMLTKEE